MLGHLRMNDSKKDPASPKNSPPDVSAALTRPDAQTGKIDAIDRLIARLYRSVLSVPAAGYRRWALEQLQRVIPHDAALWGSGLLEHWKFHSVTVHGVPDEFPQRLEATTRINPLIPRILQSLDTPVDMASVMSDDQFFHSEIYHRAFEPYGITRILSTAHLDHRSGLYSLVTLYRKNRDQPFSEEDKQRQRRLTFHLFNAASHAFFIHLARNDALRVPGTAAAVVDRSGRLHESSVRFLDLMEEYFPRIKVRELPFALPPAGQTCVHAGLVIHCEPLDDLFLVTARPSGPLDRLTEREREVVHCVTQGLTFKQAARQIGVAPSTVANHLYRIYRKLDVCSRTELAALVHKTD